MWIAPQKVPQKGEKKLQKMRTQWNSFIRAQKESIFVTTKAECSVFHYLLGCYSWLKKRGDSENGQEIGRCHPPFANYRM